MRLALKLALAKAFTLPGNLEAWILATTFWNDSGAWDDAATWSD